MATLAQLKDARNAGLNLAKATQDFAQVDILSANKDAPAVVAAVKVAADAAVLAAVAVGGSTPLIPDQATVLQGDVVVISAGGRTHSGTVQTLDGVIKSVDLPATETIINSGTHAIAATGTGTKVTFTVTAGKLSAITLSV